MDLERLIAAGLLDVPATRIDERQELLAYLIEHGATVEQMIEANAAGSLPSVAGDLVRSTERAELSVSEVASRCGVSVERVQRILVALGFPIDRDAMLPARAAILVSIFEEGSHLLGDDGIFAFTRVIGASTSTIAEAAVGLFYAEFGPNSERQEGLSELDLAHVSETGVHAFSLVPGLVAGILISQFDRAGRRAASVRNAPALSGITGETEGDPGEIIAIGFVDLVGSTEWAQQLTLRQHSLALSRFETAAWTSAVLAGGRVVKMIGDGVFFAVPTVDGACRVGAEILSATHSDPLLPTARGAIGYGLVTSREGDYFGPLVNLVSHLSEVTAPGELVITVDARDHLTDASWDVTDHEPLHVRGLDEPVAVFGVTNAGAPTPS